MAAARGVHRSWICQLLARYRAGGYGALERRPVDSQGPAVKLLVADLDIRVLGAQTAS